MQRVSWWSDTNYGHAATLTLLLEKDTHSIMKIGQRKSIVEKAILGTKITIISAIRYRISPGGATNGHLARRSLIALIRSDNQDTRLGVALACWWFKNLLN